MIEWRDVVGFPGYKVSNAGHVQGPLKVLNQRPDRKGYLFVSMRRGGLLVKRTVARLVAEAFIGPRPSGDVVRHIDGCNTNNTPANLVYGTPSQNEHDKRRHGTAPIGANHPAARLTYQQVREIRATYRPYDRKRGGAVLARKFGVTQSCISMVVRGINWAGV